MLLLTVSLVLVAVAFFLGLLDSDGKFGLLLSLLGLDR